MAKLDAAIRWLYDTCAFDQKQTFEEGESYRAAIRVLEAAAKVDKECATSGWFEWGQTKYSNQHMLNVARSIEDLLAALPEEEK